MHFKMVLMFICFFNFKKFTPSKEMTNCDVIIYAQVSLNLPEAKLYREPAPYDPFIHCASVVFRSYSGKVD